MKFFLPVFLSALLIGCSASTATNQISVTPQGEFTEINVSLQNEMIKRLTTKNTQAIEDVLATPGDYNPGVLYSLSYALFETGRKDEAMYWFYAGQLRARSDANKALDVSARQAVQALNMKFGTPINQYAFTDIPKLISVVEKVVSDDSEAPRNYDPRWIALHGMDSFNKTVVAFEPDKKWQQINQNTRQSYLQEFHSAMEQLK